MINILNIQFWGHEGVGYHGEFLINTLVAMRLFFTANPLHAYWLLNTLAGRETN